MEDGGHPNGGCESSDSRCAARARVIESHVGCEVGERCGDSANVEEATAVVMRYGCQRGENFEGCECAAGEGA